MWCRFLGQATSQPLRAAQQRLQEQRWRALLTDCSAHGQRCGAVVAGLDAAGAEAISVVVDGISLQAVFEPERFPADHQMRLLDRHLARLVAHPTGTLARMTPDTRHWPLAQRSRARGKGYALTGHTIASRLRLNNRTQRCRVCPLARARGAHLMRGRESDARMACADKLSGHHRVCGSVTVRPVKVGVGMTATLQGCPRRGAACAAVSVAATAPSTVPLTTSRPRATHSLIITLSYPFSNTRPAPPTVPPGQRTCQARAVGRL